MSKQEQTKREEIVYESQQATPDSGRLYYGMLGGMASVLHTWQRFNATAEQRDATARGIVDALAGLEVTALPPEQFYAAGHAIGVQWRRTVQAWHGEKAAKENPLRFSKYQITAWAHAVVTLECELSENGAKDLQGAAVDQRVAHPAAYREDFAAWMLQQPGVQVFFSGPVPLQVVPLVDEPEPEQTPGPDLREDEVPY